MCELPVEASMPKGSVLGQAQMESEEKAITAQYNIMSFTQVYQARKRRQHVHEWSLVKHTLGQWDFGDRVKNTSFLEATRVSNHTPCSSSQPPWPRTLKLSRSAEFRVPQEEKNVGISIAVKHKVTFPAPPQHNCHEE